MMTRFSSLFFTFIFLSICAIAQTPAQKVSKPKPSDTKAGTTAATKKVASCKSLNVFKPTLTYGTVTDQDGIVYKTIKIGRQEWMAENLRASHYRNGEAIALVANSNSWNSLTSGASCWYNNDSAANHCTYGKLYNWYAVADERHVCMRGWHEPTDEEWTTLEDFSGGLTTAGGKLKSTGTQHWNGQNVSADNSTGFSALPAGNRYGSGPFFDIGANGFWWTSTASTANEAWFRDLFNKFGLIERNAYDKRTGFSMRCVKDQK